MLGQQCSAMLLLQLHLGSRGSSYSKAVAACKFGGRFEGWTIVADINDNKKLTLL